jgi:hypothetical protein
VEVVRSDDIDRLLTGPAFRTTRLKGIHLFGIMELKFRDLGEANHTLGNLLLPHRLANIGGAHTSIFTATTPCRKTKVQNGGGLVGATG